MLEVTTVHGLGEGWLAGRPRMVHHPSPPHVQVAAAVVSPPNHENPMEALAWMEMIDARVAGREEAGFRGMGVAFRRSVNIVGEYEVAVMAPLSLVAGVVGAPAAVWL